MTRTNAKLRRLSRARPRAGLVLAATAMLVALAASTSVSAASHDISIVDFEYKPATLTVFVGEPVTWSNDAADTHTVTSDTGTELDSDNIAAGESYGHVFETPGTYTYHCAIHPQMKGAITVQAAPATSQPSGEPTPVPPEGTLPPNFSPGPSTGPLASPTIDATGAPTPTLTPTPAPSATTQPGAASDNGLPLIVGFALAVALGAAIAFLLRRGRPDRQDR